MVPSFSVPPHIIQKLLEDQERFQHIGCVSGFKVLDVFWGLRVPQSGWEGVRTRIGIANVASQFQHAFASHAVRTLLTLLEHMKVAAILISVTAVLFMGEIVPQAVCQK
jgi:hypothetical protein